MEFHLLGGLEVKNSTIEVTLVETHNSSIDVDVVLGEEILHVVAPWGYSEALGFHALILIV